MKKYNFLGLYSIRDSFVNKNKQRFVKKVNNLIEQEKELLRPIYLEQVKRLNSMDESEILGEVFYFMNDGMFPVHKINGLYKDWYCKHISFDCAKRKHDEMIYNEFNKYAMFCLAFINSFKGEKLNLEDFYRYGYEKCSYLYSYLESQQE